MQKMEEACPQLLDLIPKEREWLVSKDESHGYSEEKKLELRLCPPGQDWSNLRDNTSRGQKERDESLLSLGYFYNSSSSGNQTHHFASSERKTVLSSPWSSSPSGYPNNQTKGPSFLQFSPSSQSLPVTQMTSQPCCTEAVDLQNAEKKKASANPAVTNNTSQKRTAPAPVVGWPPIRSFRKNLASTSASKPAPESQNVNPSKVPNVKPVETSRKGMFVKINMDGVPIGRKVDLSAYASYEKLSSAVDELFRGLLAAQRDSCAGGIKNNIDEEKEITGLLDGSGEYTLVYEDNEGDRMLVGDVPWHMFVSTVKRLRVLKSSELSALSIRTGKELKN
ncbi:PREDICTED: auxin-responsive protein IAA26-like [Fragaria vesca subsp. vesca]|uniref:auxin-responsive protein IAA26-like n=1 Tax=Fragaria vesca subsp. vesca TaxID=101020 RepID=UPI0002C322D2|nr:PREDICTED: auxin-responsive protein IAA26-like [Fragaria vesca subsp. vesca]